MEVKFQIPDPRKTIASILGKINIWHIILLDAIVRFFVMTFPSDGGMIFDEVHYIKATEAMIQGIAANAEHPPLTKIIGLISIKTFGDWWFAWRFPIILFALAGTYAIYLLAKEILKDEKKALIAAALSCLDIILFIHGNIYMLEIPSLAFSLVFAYYFLKKKYFASAIFIGLGFLCNEKALFLLLGLTIYQFLSYFKWKNTSSKLIVRTGKFLFICILVGGSGLWLSDMIWKPSSTTAINIISNVVVYSNKTGPYLTSTLTTTETTYKYVSDPISHVWFMFTYFSGLNGGIPQITETWRPPWGWIAPIGDNWNNPPVYLSVAVTTGQKTLTTIAYKAQSTIPIWFMTIPIVLLAIINYKENISKFILGWIAGTYLPWLLWEPFKMNMPFNHYFMFTIPVICIGIPWFWSKVLPKHQYEAMLVHLSVVFLYFLAYFPVMLIRVF